MKKIMILAAAAALVFASCAKNEITSVNEANNHAIGFGTYAPRSITKANNTLVDNGALPAGSQIGIYGYSDGTNKLAADAGTLNPTFMTNALVNYDGVDSGTATPTTPVRYWPKTTTNVLSFYGYYPYNNAAITAKPSDTTTGLGTFNFAQPVAVADMVDFMVSNVANDQYYYTDGTDGYAENGNGVKAMTGIVPLTFNHMLSKVNFKFSHNVELASGDKIVVTSVSLAAVKTTGTLTPHYAENTSAANALGTTSFAWSAQNNAAAVTIPITNDGNGGQLLVKDNPKINNGTAKTDTDFLFIPQTIGDDVIITINYNIIQGGNTTANVATVKLNTIQFSGAALTAWEINKFYTYSFVIGLKEIKFTGNVVNWTDAGVGTINI